LPWADFGGAVKLSKIGIPHLAKPTSSDNPTSPLGFISLIRPYGLIRIYKALSGFSGLLRPYKAYGASEGLIGPDKAL